MAFKLSIYFMNTPNNLLMIESFLKINVSCFRILKPRLPLITMSKAVATVIICCTLAKLRHGYKVWIQ